MVFGENELRCGGKLGINRCELIESNRKPYLMDFPPL